MTDTLDLAKLGLDTEFPDRLYVVHHVPSGKYGCFSHEGIHGLACFSAEILAYRFTEYLSLNGMRAEEVTFDEAREIAKGRPQQVVAIMLLDCMDNPKIHYVR